MKDEAYSGLIQDEITPKVLKKQQIDFCAHLRHPDHYPSPPGIEDRRIKIYRDLFYNNIEGFIKNGFPVLYKITDESVWHAMIRDFFHRHVNKTPYFHEICEGFLAYLQTERLAHPDSENDPAFILELAYYEWTELALDIEDAEVTYPSKRPDFLNSALWGNVKPLLSPLAWVQAYQYPVHQVSSAFIPEAPADTPVCLIVYRNRDEQVKFMEINPFTARFLALLDSSELETTNDLLAQLKQESNLSLDMLHEPTMSLLEQLYVADILL